MEVPIQLHPQSTDPPRDCAPASPEGPWRDGLLLVVAPSTHLPERCIKCNAETMRLRGSRKISTLSAWYPLFASAGWDAQSVQDHPIHITFGLCPRHRLERLACAALIGVLGSACVVGVAILQKTRAFGPLTDAIALLTPLPFLAASLLIRPAIRPRRVYQGLAWFTGADSQFLDSLPELDAQPIQSHPRPV